MTKTSLLLAAVVAISLGAFASAQAENRDQSDLNSVEQAQYDPQSEGTKIKE